MKARWIGIVTALAAASPGSAAQHMRMVFHGSVSQITGSGGGLDASNVGDSYTLTYFADFSKGIYGGGGGGFGSETYLLGGTSLPGDQYSPAQRLTPISTKLSIAGHDLDFSGAYLGSLIYVDNSLDTAFGGDGESWADFVAEDGDGAANNIVSHIESDNFLPFGGTSVDQPVSVDIDGFHITGTSTFSYSFTDGSGKQWNLSGNLDPTSYSATAAVPEPSSWAMMITGTALAGATLRLGRRRDRLTVRPN